MRHVMVGTAKSVTSRCVDEWSLKFLLGACKFIIDPKQAVLFVHMTDFSVGASEPSNRKMDLDEVSANDGFVPISVNAPALGQLLADHWTKEGAAFLPPHFF